MPARLNLFATPRASAYRPRQPLQFTFFAAYRLQQPVCRSYSSNPSKDLPTADKGETVGPNMDQQEHVSEEAAKMAKMTGGEGPDLTQGTPVQDLLKDDKEAQKHAPQVSKDSLKANTTPPKPQSRTFSTYARRALDQEVHPPASADLPSTPFPSAVAEATNTQTSVDPTSQGHKFGLPDSPSPSNMHKDYRYDPVVKQVTNSMMQDGKSSVAQRNMSYISQHLRTASPPTYNPNRPLVPGAPPASHLPLNPILYLTLALDSVAPLSRIRSQRGAAGGGVALQIPVPLGVRQRRRTAFMWISDAAGKRKARGSGRGGFAQRIAEESVAVVEGRSAVWEKRTGVHRIATTARSNLNVNKGRR